MGEIKTYAMTVSNEELYSFICREDPRAKKIADIASKYLSFVGVHPEESFTAFLFTEAEERNKAVEEVRQEGVATCGAFWQPAYVDVKYVTNPFDKPEEDN